ncbi:MAG: histidinol dehydrogenase [Candidatus Marinimicrobia bacterium]|nr:histidinol dehydrogenase [Candidatus Neomarinimicrobiota bacterium]
MQKLYKPNMNFVKRLFDRKNPPDSAMLNTVMTLFEDVKRNGDEAVKNYTLKFDQVKLEILTLPIYREDFEASIDPSLKEAIAYAAENIRIFHEKQIPSCNENYTLNIRHGVTCSFHYLPIESVGIYIPGGTAPLFSTALMLVIPAQLAGCEKIVCCTPPDRKGSVNPVIGYTLTTLGIDTVYLVGGAQAIAAMTYGTQSIPRVAKIAGPGNSWVTLAKQVAFLYGTGIDLPAGPSEVAILADDSANVPFVAADCLSQAEHGFDSQVLVVTTSERLFNDLIPEITVQISHLSRGEMAVSSLDNSYLIYVPNQEEAVHLINLYAPEHLIIHMENPHDVSNQIKYAGSVFVGPFTPESAGDYASGTNHILPTSGNAVNTGGVTVKTFMKTITTQSISPEGLKELGPHVITMAKAENLQAHAEAVQIRLNALKG